mgnify:CR=1 FL=1
MVKHGRNKKRRAGRIGRTKLKENGNWATWNPKPRITDATVKKLWDVKKTPKQNLAAMGLSMDINNKPEDDTDHHDIQMATTNNKPNVIELFDVPESDEHGKSRRVPLQKEEQEYMVACLEKYGTNYRRMFRDTKVNFLQHTEDKLRKMGARFLLLERDQVLVNEEDIPDKVKTLMNSASGSSSGEMELNED